MAPSQDLAKYGNPALHVTPENKIYVAETEVPVPEADEVIVHVRCTGICGSDLHLWHAGGIGPLRVDQHCILGHEAAGQVVQVGSAVTTLRPGDRVAIEPGVPCETCFLCRQGKYNLCEAVKFAGVCPYAGTCRRFMAHPARYAHKIADNVTYAQGALLEPLSVVMHAITLCHGSLEIGKPALICSAGPIGLIALACARASGAWPLAITDVDQSRLEFAQKFVPGVMTHRVNVKATPVQSSEAIRNLFKTGPRDLDKNTFSENEYGAPSTVLECTGIESSVATAAYCARRSGTVMVIGVGRSIMNNLPFMHLSLAEIDLKFTNRYVDTWPAAANALAGKVVDLDMLVTQVYKLEDAVKAMETCADPKTPSVKIHIVDDTEIPLPSTNGS